MEMCVYVKDLIVWHICHYLSARGFVGKVWKTDE